MYNIFVLPRNLDRTSDHLLFLKWIFLPFQWIKSLISLVFDFDIIQLLTSSNGPTVQSAISFQITGPWGMGDGLNSTERDAIRPDPGEILQLGWECKWMQTERCKNSKVTPFCRGKKDKVRSNLVVVNVIADFHLEHGKLLDGFHACPRINLTSPSPKDSKAFVVSCCIIQSLGMSLKSWQGNIVTYNTIISALEILGWVTEGLGKWPDA